MKKKEILFVSMFAPYDEVPHAGGKVHNYYVKQLKKRDNVHFKLISMCYAKEEAKLDLEKYEIENDIIVLDKNIFNKNIRKAISGFSYINPFDKYGNTLLNYERFQIKRKIKKYKREGNIPDIIILQWTQIAFLLPYIKKLFPNSRYAVIEEDVLFLNFQRRIQLANTVFKKIIAKYQFYKIKKLELEVLREADVIVTNNPKDTKLLHDNGLAEQKIFTSTVFFEDFSNIDHETHNKNILFYGAMNRLENCLSVKWFVDNVFPFIEDNEVQLIIIGGNPTKEILDMQNERIVVTGYVNDVAQYFKNCMCMVAPLVLGAGIKVKVLEAMSAGVPILTNDIGMEGINAQNGIHYFHCNTPEDYLQKIKLLADNKIDISNMSKEMKHFIKKEYDIHVKVNEFYDMILRV